MKVTGEDRKKVSINSPYK